MRLDYCCEEWKTGAEHSRGTRGYSPRVATPTRSVLKSALQRSRMPFHGRQAASHLQVTQSAPVGPNFTQGEVC